VKCFYNIILLNTIQGLAILIIESEGLTIKRFYVFICIVVVLSLLTACVSKGTKEADVYEIGTGWIDNIIDAYQKINNAPNQLTRDGDMEYMHKSIGYYKETLGHATKEEKEQLQKYFEEKAGEIGLKPEELLNIGGDQ